MRGWAMGLGLTALLAATTACGKKEESRAEADRAAAKAGFVPPSVTSRVDFGSLMARRFRELDRDGNDIITADEMPRPIPACGHSIATRTVKSPRASSSKACWRASTAWT